MKEKNKRDAELDEKYNEREREREKRKGDRRALTQKEVKDRQIQ